MAKIEIVQVTTAKDSVNVIWKVSEDDGSFQETESGNFPLGDQAAIDASIKKSIENYVNASATRGTIQGKVGTVDKTTGEIVYEDKPAGTTREDFISHLNKFRAYSVAIRDGIRTDKDQTYVDLLTWLQTNWDDSFLDLF